MNGKIPINKLMSHGLEEVNQIDAEKVRVEPVRAFATILNNYPKIELSHLSYLPPCYTVDPDRMSVIEVLITPVNYVLQDSVIEGEKYGGDKVKEVMDRNFKTPLQEPVSATPLIPRDEDRIRELIIDNRNIDKMLCEKINELTLAQERIKTLEDILKDALSSFQITQKVSDYPNNHWCVMARKTLQSPPSQE